MKKIIKRKRSVSDIIIIIIIMLLLAGNIYNFYRNSTIKKEFQDFTMFQIEFSQYLTEKLNSTYEIELETFLKSKADEILNNVNFNTREIDNE